MIHRKREHTNTVWKCDLFKEGSCGFTENFCWFKHSRNMMNAEYESNESVFHGAQERLKPPLRKEN